MLTMRSRFLKAALKVTPCFLVCCWQYVGAGMENLSYGGINRNIDKKYPHKRLTYES